MNKILIISCFILFCSFIKAQSNVDSSALDTTLKELQIIKKESINLSTPRIVVIKRIELEGTNRSKSAVLIRSGLAEGDEIKLPSDATTDAVKKLWDSKLFTDVKLYLKRLEGNEATLLFKFKETPQISKTRVVKAQTGKNPSKSEREDLSADLKNLTYRPYNQNVILEQKKSFENIMKKKVDYIQQSFIILKMTPQKTIK